MSTTVEELKKLYTKMGGQEDVSGIQTDAEMIDKLEDVAVPAELPAVTSEDNGDVLGVVEGAWAKMDVPAELPAVTASDNGKVLGVVEGAWAKADVPSDFFVVKIVGSESSATFEQIVAKVGEGKTIVFDAQDDAQGTGRRVMFPTVMWSWGTNPEITGFDAYFMYVYNNKLIFYKYSMNSTSAVTKTSTEYTLTQA